jgi:PAS domain S-box-containing protein
MVDWAAYLEALAVDDFFASPGEPSVSRESKPDRSGSSRNEAERLLIPVVQQLLPAFLAQTPSIAGVDREVALRDAGRALAEQASRAGLSLSACLAAQGHIRDNLIALAGRIFPAGDLAGPILELLRFSDGILAGLVAEWSRLKSINLRRRHREARRYILRERKKYAAVFKRMEEPAFVVDRELRLLDVNPAFEQFFGLKARDCLGLTCKATIGHGFCPQCPLASVVRKGGSFSGVEVNLEGACSTAPGGRILRTVLMAGTALGEEGEVAGGAIVILQNITEQKRAEAELRRSEEKFRSLVENLPDVIWRADHQGRVLFVSSNCQSILGTAKEELSGSDRFARVHPEDLPELRRIYARLIENGEAYDTRYRYQRGDGTWIWLRERAAATSDEPQGAVCADGLSWDISEFINVEGELEEYRSWLEDMVDERTEEMSRINRKLKKEISERRRVEKELIRLTASLKQSNAELEQFAYVTSHDLKEPLMLITAFAERLQLRYSEKLDARGREYLGRIVKAAGKLRELIDALLELSRVSTSHRPFERLELQRLVREVLDDLEECIRSSGARVEVVDLPDLNGDEVQIRQLFQNLISNALKYRRRETVPEVSISGRLAEEGYCEITITDNGIGLSADDVEKIFEPFVRLHGSEVYEGSGMGLTTCRKIVDRHGGEIKALSRPGQGAVFVIRLPIRHPTMALEPDQG